MCVPPKNSATNVVNTVRISAAACPQQRRMGKSMSSTRYVPLVTRNNSQTRYSRLFPTLNVMVCEEGVSIRLPESSAVTSSTRTEKISSYPTSELTVTRLRGIIDRVLALQNKGKLQASDIRDFALKTTFGGSVRTQSRCAQRQTVRSRNTVPARGHRHHPRRRRTYGWNMSR